jgi:tetratricopeptide (TPR) repeat protein
MTSGVIRIVFYDFACSHHIFNIRSFNHAVRSLEQQLKLPEAKAAFQKALDLDPNYEEAQKALLHIKDQSI